MAEPTREELEREKLSLEVRRLRRPPWLSAPVLFGVVTAAGTIGALVGNAKSVEIERERALLAKERAERDLATVDSRLKQAKDDLAKVESDLQSSRSETSAVQSRLEQTTTDLQQFRAQVR